MINNGKIRIFPNITSRMLRKYEPLGRYYVSTEKCILLVVLHYFRHSHIMLKQMLIYKSLKSTVRECGDEASFLVTIAHSFQMYALPYVLNITQIDCLW